MPEKKYDLIITSVEADAELTVLSQKLGKVLRKNPQQIEFSLNEIACLSGGTDFPIVQGTTEMKAKQLQAYLVKQGLGSKLREEIGLELMVESTEYFCPACGHKQEKVDDNKDICEACGVIGRKYANIRKRKDILESERRRHQAVDKFSADESRKQMARQEDERLREEARKQLGIQKQKKPLLLASFIVLFGVGSVMAYLYQDQLLLAAGVVSEQDIEFTEAGMKMVNKGSNGQKPMLMIPPSGGSISLKMPEGSANGDSPMESSQATVATIENMPAMTDSESQNLALQMYQHRSEEQQRGEAKLKATLVAHGIDSPIARKAVLEMMGSQEASVNQDILDSLTSQPRRGDDASDPYLDELQMLVDSQLLQGDYSQAVKMSEKAKNKYQEAVLLHDIVKSEIKTKQDKQQIDLHIAHLAKLIWNEPDPINQVKIQGLLSTAYDLAGEKKIASLNLVMAIEKLRFVDKIDTKVDLLCQLSKTQRAVGNINQAREILKLAEEKTGKLVETKQSKAYAEIANDYALALDFPSAMNMSDKISDPVLLKDTLRHIAEIQGKYMSLSNPPV